MKPLAHAGNYRVSYKEDYGTGMTAIGRWIGVPFSVIRLISYWIITQKGTVIPRMTVQCLTSLDNDTDEVKVSVSYFDTGISCCFKEEESLTFDGSKPNPEDWSEYLEYDLDFQDDFDSIINDLNVPEVDAHFTPDVFDDTYLNMDLEIPRDVDRAEFAKVMKCFRDRDGLPIGRSHNNQTMDTRMY